MTTCQFSKWYLRIKLNPVGQHHQYSCFRITCRNSFTWHATSSPFTSVRTGETTDCCLRINNYVQWCMAYIAHGRWFQDHEFWLWFIKYLPSDVPRLRVSFVTPVKYFSKVGKTRVCSYKLAALWSLSLGKLLIKCLEKSEVENMLGCPVPHRISHNNWMSRKCVSGNGKVDSFCTTKRISYRFTNSSEVSVNY